MKLKCKFYKVLLFIFFNKIFFSLINASVNTKTDFQLSAFQELLTVSSIPYNQLKFTYNISPDYARTSATGSGSVTGTGGFAVLDSGTTSNGSANLRSINRLIYNPGQGSVATFSSIFSRAGVAGNYQIIGIGNAEDGFFFGYTGTQFGILWRSNSSGTPVDTWIPQTSWNTDTMNGTGPSGMILDPTKGNIYKIQYQWLGFGAVNFYIENPTGTMQLVHQLKYANNNTQTTVRNPSLQLRADTVNFQNTTTGGQVKTSAMVGSSEGQIKETLAVRNDQEIQGFVINSTTPSLDHILTIYNKQIYQGRTNQVMVFPDLVTSLTTQNQGRNAVFYIYKNPTFSTTGTFTDVDTNNSVVSYSTGTNTVVSSNGQLVGVIYTKPSDSQYVELLSQSIALAPDEYLSVLGTRTVGGGGSLLAYLSLSWQEFF